MPPSPSLPRRTVLVTGTALAAALPLAACGLLDTAPAAPDPVTGALDALRAREEALVARYDRAFALFPALRDRLGSVRADHLAHAEALRAVLSARSPQASPSPAPAVPSPSGSPSEATVRAELAREETETRAAATAAALLAEGDTAALLASVAACESTHLVVLR